MLVVALGLSLTATPLGGTTSLAGPAERPNVLIFLTDDQRQGLEVMGAVRRNIAERGRSYPNAFVTTPSCCPSRASIFTGRYAHNHNVATNLEAADLSHNTTLQFYLQRAGYRTGYIGKFLNGWKLNQGPPFFNEWAINAPDTTERKLRYYDGPVNVNGAINTLPEYSTTFWGEKADDFIRRWNRTNDDKPWLLYVAPNAPHPPLVPEKKYEEARVGAWAGSPGTREKNRTDKPQWVRDAHYSFKKGRKTRKKQYQMLKSVNDMTKRVMTVLRQTDEAKDTLVIFISDNGYSWSEHGLIGKFNPYTESVQVPLLVHWPQHLDAGDSDERLVANIDIAPTVLQAVGVTPDGPPMDGQSLLDPAWTRDRLLLEYREHPYAPAPDWASTRTQTFQYIEYYDEAGDITFSEYYNLIQDPGQNNNVLGNDDPLDDPLTVPALSIQLSQDRQCEGAVACP